MSGSEEEPCTLSDGRLSVAWLRQQLAEHGPQAAPPEAIADASLKGLANPPVDGLAASFAMLDASDVAAALNELPPARDALLEAYAGLARAFDDQAARGTVFDEYWGDAS